MADDEQKAGEVTARKRWNRIRWGAIGLIVIVLAGEALAKWYFGRDEASRAAYEPYSSTISSVVTGVLIVSCVLVYFASRMRLTSASE